MFQDDSIDVRPSRQEEMILDSIEGNEGVTTAGHHLSQPPGHRLEDMLLSPLQQPQVIATIQDAGIFF